MPHKTGRPGVQVQNLSCELGFAIGFVLSLSTLSSCKAEQRSAPGGVKEEGALRETPKPRASSSAASGRGVGEACANDGECATGECIKEAEHSAWLGGYCSVTRCDANCPSGSRCSGGGAIHTRGCFRECVLGEPCRDGYRCCPGQGDAGPPGLCVPAKGTGLSCTP